MSKYKHLLRDGMKSPRAWQFPAKGLDDAAKVFIDAVAGDATGGLLEDQSTVESDFDTMATMLDAHPDLRGEIGSYVFRYLAWRSKDGSVPTLEWLLDNGIRPAIDPTVFNFVYDAHPNAKRFVFERGLADATMVSVKKPHTGWPDNTSLLYWAVAHASIEEAKLVLEYGAGQHHELQIKGNGERGTTSLQEAVATINDPLAQGVRSKAAREIFDIYVTDGAYYDIFCACGLDDAGRVGELLVETEDLALVEDPFGMTPMHWAARSGSVDCAAILADQGAHVGALNKGQRAPLHLAADHNRSNMIRFLASHGADLDVQDKSGRTPLHRATYGGMADAAETLLGLGADPWIVNKRGKNALEIARKDAKYLKNRA